MKIEVLFPEFCNLYGDGGNIKFLAKSAPDIEIIYTNNQDIPTFVSERVDMVYMGSMPEDDQIVAVDRLKPYIGRIKELIDDNVVFLITGNAMEIFGKYIQDKDKTIPMLGIFDYHADRYIKEERHNSFFMGEFENMKILGNKSQFSFIRNVNEPPFAKVLGGCGNSMGDEHEGVHINNFFATYLLGPVLVMNPSFTKYLLRLIGHDDTLSFENEAIEAYERYLNSMEDKDMLFIFDEHF